MGGGFPSSRGVRSSIGSPSPWGDHSQSGSPSSQRDLSQVGSPSSQGDHSPDGDSDRDLPSEGIGPSPSLLQQEEGVEILDCLVTSRPQIPSNSLAPNNARVFASSTSLSFIMASSWRFLMIWLRWENPVLPPHLLLRHSPRLWSNRSQIPSLTQTVWSLRCPCPSPVGGKKRGGRLESNLSNFYRVLGSKNALHSTHFNQVHFLEYDSRILIFLKYTSHWHNSCNQFYKGMWLISKILNAMSKWLQIP